MTLRYMTGESREDEERRNCPRCDHYRGYVCAEHREPSYAELEAENARLKRAIESFGKNPAGFDWGVLNRVAELEAEVERLKTEPPQSINNLLEWMAAREATITLGRCQREKDVVIIGCWYRKNGRPIKVEKRVSLALACWERKLEYFLEEALRQCMDKLDRAVVRD